METTKERILKQIEQDDKPIYRYYQSELVRFLENLGIEINYNTMDRAQDKMADYLNQLDNEIESFLDENRDDIENEYRICSQCKEKMQEGYCIEGGMEYYCSDECLEKNMTREEFLELYDDGDGESYYTEWE